MKKTLKIKTPKLKELFINVAVFKTDVIILIGEKHLVLPWARKNIMPEVFEEFEKKWTADDNHKTVKRSTQAQGHYFCGGGSIFWFPRWDLTVAVHEMAHAHHHMLMERGIMLCDETDEVYAYTIEYLYKKIKQYDSNL
jgi:hypothetical protein